MSESEKSKEIEFDAKALGAELTEVLTKAFRVDMPAGLKDSLGGAMGDLLGRVIPGGSGGSNMMTAISGAAQIAGGDAIGGTAGLLSGLTGSPLSFFGGGLGGVLGGVSMVASLVGSFTKRGTRSPLSDVKPIFEPSIRDSGGGLDTLFGSDVFETAAFSSRNGSGDVLRKFASSRVEQAVTVNVNASSEFDATVDDRWVKTSKLNEMSGIPRRTNFNHG